MAKSRILLYWFWIIITNYAEMAQGDCRQLKVYLGGQYMR